MTNVIVLLLGFPGTGKLSVAQLLAAELDAVIVDNHWINNPIFGVLRPDGVTPLPPDVWKLTHQVRAAVMETIAALSPRALNFIFTYSGSNGEPYDERSYELMRATAERRGALLVPVRLLCGEDELIRRIVSEDRRARMKATSADTVVAYRGKTVFDPRHPNQLDLDVTSLSASETAQAIRAHLSHIGG